MNLLSYFASRKKSTTHIIILVALASLVLLVPAGMWDLRGPDEGRYTQIAKELLTSHNWFALTVMGKPYDQKPPLGFWLFALALTLNGGQVSSWFLRLPSVLAAIGTVLTTYFIGKRFAGPAAGYISGLFLLSSVAILDDAPTVELNMMYTFFTTACLTVWLLHLEQDRLTWPQWMSFWLLLAAAFLVKGPLAIVIVLSALGAVAWNQRSRQPFRNVRFVWGFPFFLLIIAGWLWAQSRAFGSSFVQHQASEQTIQRFLKGDHGESFWYYFPRIFTAVLGPWALFFCAALWNVWRNRRHNNTITAALVGWMTLPFILLLFANGKRVPYLLPLVPAASILAGIWTTTTLGSRVVNRPWRRLVSLILLISGISIFVAGIAIYTRIPHSIFQNPKFERWTDFDRLWPAIWLIAGGTIIALAWQASRTNRTWIEICWAIGLFILLVQAVDFICVRPAFDPGKSTRVYSQKVTATLDSIGEDTIATLPKLGEPEFNVYGHYKVHSAAKRDMDLIGSNLPRVLALTDDEIKTSGPAALAAGYQERLRLNVTKQPVRIYVRAKETHHEANRGGKPH